MAAPQDRAATAVWVHEYLIEEDEMGDSAAQSDLLDSLVAVLRWLYRAQGWYVARNLTLYHPAILNRQQMISPDIAIFKDIVLTAEERETLTSWDMRAGGRACPPVIVESSSGSTWRTDIRPGTANKPSLYGRMGVREYYAYDPNRTPVWRGVGRRLLGRRYDALGEPQPLAADERGWLWSAELESWLAPDGPLLRLYDAQGERRLTEAEAVRASLAAALGMLRETGIDPGPLDM